jgi:hypothetical protein
VPVQSSGEQTLRQGLEGSEATEASRGPQTTGKQERRLVTATRPHDLNHPRKAMLGQQGFQQQATKAMGPPLVQLAGLVEAVGHLW